MEPDGSVLAGHLARLDDRGVPMDIATAKTLTQQEIERAVIAVVAEVEAVDVESVSSWDRETDGTIALESQLAVDVLHEFTGHLGKVPLDLAEIPHERWTSVGGLVKVIADAYVSYEEHQ